MNEGVLVQELVGLLVQPSKSGLKIIRKCPLFGHHHHETSLLAGLLSGPTISVRLCKKCKYPIPIQSATPSKTIGSFRNYFLQVRATQVKHETKEKY